MFRTRFLLASAASLLLLTAGGLAAQVARQEDDLLSSLAFSAPRLRPAPALQPLEAAEASLAPEVRGGWAGFQAGSPVRWQAYVDRRTGLVASAVGGGIPWIIRGTGDLARLE